MPNNITLLDLPLEVLDFIFKHLSPSHKLRLADSHPILAEAFRHHVGDLYKKINLDELPPADWSLILQLSGYNVQEIDIGFNFKINSPVFTLIPRHCKNLEYIKSSVGTSSVEAVCSLLLKLDGLKSVDILLITERRQPELYDPEYTINVLHQIPTLRKLKIRDIPFARINFIQQFVDLEELDLSGIWFRVFDMNIFKICAPLRKLRSLRVEQLSVTKEPFENDGYSFQFLEKLTFRRCKVNQKFPLLPMLKSVDITCLGDLILYYVVLPNYGNTLQKVELNVSFISVGEILTLVKSCRHLRYLSVRSDIFETISKIDMSLFIDLLRKNGVTSDNPFELTFVGNIECWIPSLKVVSGIEFLVQMNYFFK
ncbi:hypothetical protein KR084_009225 [Drosophila pseudotakahashii]|nr:hypothetical protein KR084_009225 [Drosophila pseudotakahashii]